MRVSWLIRTQQEVGNKWLHHPQLISCQADPAGTREAKMGLERQARSLGFLMRAARSYGKL